MPRLIVYLLRAGGVFLLLCGVVPFFYGILNTGTAALLLLGTLLVLLPHLWSTALLPYPFLRGCIAVGGCAGLLFCLAVSLLMARHAWFNAPPQGDAAPKEALPVVVLGGKVNGDQPSLMLRRRLDVAHDYLAANPEAVCVVSGGQGPDEAYAEALVMRNYLMRQGISAARIQMEDQSTNTRQNLRYSIALLGETDRVVIVTDSFHQLRASVYARAEGAGSYNLSSLTPWGLMPGYWLREILGVSWAWLTIRLGMRCVHASPKPYTRSPWRPCGYISWIIDETRQERGIGGSHRDPPSASYEEETGSHHLDHQQRVRCAHPGDVADPPGGLEHPVPGGV